MDNDGTESEVKEEVVESAPGLGERVARMEGILGQVAERLNHVEERLNHLEQRLESRFNRIEDGQKDLNRGQWRVVWIVIGMWVSVIVTILLKS